MWKKLTFGTMSVIVALVLAFCFAPMKTVAYTISESYEETETYYEKEPYIEQEAYVEQVPYQTTEDYYTTQNKNYSLWDNGLRLTL